MNETLREELLILIIEDKFNTLALNCSATRKILAPLHDYAIERVQAPDFQFSEINSDPKLKSYTGLALDELWNEREPGGWNRYS